VKIKIHLIPETGAHLEGDEPPVILDIKEPLFRFEKPIHYVLHASWVGHRSLLFMGKLSVVIKAQCVRTLEWFDYPIVIDPFQCHIEGIRGDEVDLTQQIREDILLQLPTNPVSPNTKPVNTGSSAESEGGSEVWGKLDKIIKNK
jgi:uncharacterized metal-binding protein YceD (DUF177 family)